MLSTVSNIVTGVFGSRNQRLLKTYGKLVATANALEPELTALTDEALRETTLELKKRYAAEKDLDALVPEAFAVVREAARRALKMRHFDVQLIGGITLHQGKIAEMRTGEGKTLVATLAVYLNALTGRGVHVVTVNEYLAQRDADWMAPVYRFLGLEVGVIKSNQSVEEKRAAYGADITYGTNNEFGFDYLRDNLAFRLEDRVQRGLNFAIVDEVDSILIDEARTPLIISGRSEESTELYVRINQLIPSLKLHDPPPGNPHAGFPKFILHAGFTADKINFSAANTENVKVVPQAGFGVQPVFIQRIQALDFTIAMGEVTAGPHQGIIVMQIIHPVVFGQ